MLTSGLNNQWVENERISCQMVRVSEICCYLTGLPERTHMVIFVTIFITGTNQVCLISNNIVPLQSGSVFYNRAQLTGAQY